LPCETICVIIIYYYSLWKPAYDYIYSKFNFTQDHIRNIRNISLHIVSVRQSRVFRLPTWTRRRVCWITATMWLRGMKIFCNRNLKIKKIMSNNYCKTPAINYYSATEWKPHVLKTKGQRVTMLITVVGWPEIRIQTDIYIYTHHIYIVEVIYYIYTEDNFLFLYNVSVSGDQLTPVKTYI